MSPISVRLTMPAAAFALPPPHHSRTGIKSLRGLICREEVACRKGLCCSGKITYLNMITSINQIPIRASNTEEALPDDPLSLGAGLEPTLNNLGKWLVSVLTSGIILWRHDAGALWAATGAVLNIALSIALKNILNQERPIPDLRSDPGMPSSHSQTLFYMVTFLCITLVECRGMSAETAILTGIFLVVNSYFSWLRVSQQLHTLSQVIVGAIIGSIFSLSWFWSWYALIFKHCTSMWVRLVLASGGVAYWFASLVPLVF